MSACAAIKRRRLISFIGDIMEYLFNGFTLETTPGCFPLSTDSMVLCRFIKLTKNARVLDLGSGCGTLGTLLCAGDPNCTVLGMELDAAAHSCALENIRRNALTGRLESICADLRNVPDLVASGSFSCCISNPPYFSSGPASQATPLARREDCCHPGDLMKAAAWALKFGGDFYLVHKPERLAELITTAAAHGLEAKRLGLVRHAPESAVSMILLQFRKGGKPGLILEEFCLFDSSDKPTNFYKEVYHME